MASFPVSNKGVIIKDWFDQYALPRSTAVLGRNLTISNPSGAGYSFGIYELNPKQMVYIDSMAFSSNKGLEINVVYANNTLRGAGTLGFGDFRAVTPVGGGCVVLPINQMLPGSLVRQLTFFVSAVLEAENTGIYVSVSINAKSIYEDINFTAENKILCLGDSILLGYTGAQRKDQHFLWMFKRFFEKQTSKAMQIINMSIAGSTSQLARDFLQLGRVSEISGVQLIFENHGTNDASQNTSVADFNAYLEEITTIKRSYFSGATMIMFGSSKLQNPTTDAAAQVFRTLKQQKVTALNDPKIIYIDLAPGMTPNADRFVTSDPPNNGIHPNTLGNQETGNYGIQQFINKGITI